MKLRWHPALPGLVALGVLSGCGSGSGSGKTDYTLRVEVTSSGSPLAFTGTVSPNTGPKVPISGTTPFALNIADESGFITADSADATKATKSGAVLTLCLKANSHQSCNSTTAADPDTAFVVLFPFH